MGSNFVYDDNDEDDDIYTLFIFVFHSGGVIGQTFTSKYLVLIYKHWALYGALYGMFVAHITTYCTSECPATCMLQFLLEYIFYLYYVTFRTSFSHSFISFCLIAWSIVVMLYNCVLEALTSNLGCPGKLSQFA